MILDFSLYIFVISFLFMVCCQAACIQRHNCTNTTTPTPSVSLTSPTPPATHTVSLSLTRHTRTLTQSEGTATETPTFTITESLQNTASNTRTETLTTTFTDTSSVSITPPPSPTKTRTRSETLVISETETISTTLSAPKTVTPTRSNTATLIITQTSTYTLTSSFKISPSVTMPHTTIVRHRSIYEDALRYGVPIDDRILIINLHNDELDLANADRFGVGRYFFNCIELDIAEAPSLKHFLGRMWTKESPHSLNQSMFLQLVFYPDHEYRLIRRDAENPEKVGLRLMPECLMYHSEMNWVNFSILPGTTDPAPPFIPEPRHVVKELEIPVTIMTMLSAFLTASPLPVLHLGRLASISALGVCQGYQEPLTFFESPTRYEFDIHDENARTRPYLGAIVMNTVLILSLLILHFFFVWGATCFTYKRAEGQRHVYGMAMMQFPSRSIWGVMWLAPTLKCVTVVFFLTDTLSLLVSCFAAFVFWVAIALFCYWMSATSILNATSAKVFVPKFLKKTGAAVTGRQGHFGPGFESSEFSPKTGGAFLAQALQNQNDVASSGSRWGRRAVPDPFADLPENARQPTFLSILLMQYYHDRERWSNRYNSYPTFIHPKISAWLYFVQRFSCFFHDFVRLRYWFLMVELSITVLIGLVDGIGLGTGNCGQPLWAITSILLINFCLHVYFHPYNSFMNGVLYTALAFVEFLAALLATFGHQFDWRNPQIAAQIIIDICISVFLLKGLIDVAVFIYEVIVDSLIPGEPIFKKVPVVPIPFVEIQQREREKAKHHASLDPVLSVPMYPRGKERERLSKGASPSPIPDPNEDRAYRNWLEGKEMSRIQQNADMTTSTSLLPTNRDLFPQKNRSSAPYDPVSLATANQALKKKHTLMDQPSGMLPMREHDPTMTEGLLMPMGISPLAPLPSHAPRSKSAPQGRRPPSSTTTVMIGQSEKESAAHPQTSGGRKKLHRHRHAHSPPDPRLNPNHPAEDYL